TLASRAVTLRLRAFLAEAPDERSQQEGPLGALEDRHEPLVDRRVRDECADRPLALLDLFADLLEVRHRDPQVLDDLAQAAAVPVGDERAERAPPARDPVRHVAEVTRDSPKVLERLLILRVEEECREEALVGPGPVDQASEPIHPRDEPPCGVRPRGREKHARGALALGHAIEELLRRRDGLVQALERYRLLVQKGVPPPAAAFDLIDDSI